MGKFILSCRFHCLLTMTIRLLWKVRKVTPIVRLNLDLATTDCLETAEGRAELYKNALSQLLYYVLRLR